MTATLVEGLKRTKKEVGLTHEEGDALPKKLKQLQTPLPVLGADGRTASAVGFPSSKTISRGPVALPRRSGKWGDGGRTPG